MNETTATNGRREQATFTAWRDLQVDGRLQPDQHARIIRSERAARLRIMSTTCVPGLVQARGWAMAMAGALPALGEYQPRDGEAAAQARLARQRILTEPGRDIHILMHLAALRTRRPQPVFDEQIDHLMRATNAEHFRFGVIPDFVDTGIDLASDFFLYDEAVVEIGTVAGEVRSTAREDVELCERVFDAFAATACYGPTARELLAAFAAEATAARRMPAASPTTGSER
ncbi:Scr1 family TA system antitoxin-like transcriptional regulator [Catenulispora pinisilvae]|uniref:Scr1 family TA system antitoxin-like transcriptional regulator n=1 Tax=Catenulispora pinisilvae TaxID=2705253 RepID=UPI001890E623|nr:Scr1 family TA system antitoxin-like transcriptional regulator [Catenulispora pinisilvae]